MYIYDGSFDGLLSVIFDAYKVIENINIKSESTQGSFFESIYVKTDMEKATRVRTGVEKLSKSFLSDIMQIYLSDSEDREDVIARCIKKVYQWGLVYLNSSDESAVRYREILKNLRNEIHKYKGVLRFREIQEGFLLAEFTPHNDIILQLSLHFLDRLPNEKFIIYDVERKKASFCIDGELEIVGVEDLNAKDSEEEKIFKSAWQSFYSAVGIEERKNKKLMISNMPKKYWKYLPEREYYDKKI